MRNFRLLILAFFLSGGGLGFSALAQQQPGATPPTQEERLRELEQKQKVLERKLELKEESEQAKTKESVSVGAGKEGFYLKSADGQYQVKLRGLIQADVRYFVPGRDKDSSTFLLRRVRPILEGTVYSYYDFRFTPDFGEGKTVIYDAYVDVHYWSEFRVRAGKFKPPVGLERLQSASDLLLVERGLPTNLVPNRDIGVQLWGEAAKGVFQYAAGVFNGVPDGANTDKDVNGDKDYAGRVFLRPFFATQTRSLKNLGIGFAGSYGEEKGTLTSPDLPGFKTPAQMTFFSYRSTGTDPGTAVSHGTHSRLSPQGYYYGGPFGLLGEYVISKQEVKIGDTEATILNRAWQAEASIVLTGEAASYQGVNPKHPFDPKARTWGAWELAGRYGELAVDPDAFPVFADPAKSAKQAREWGIGLNGYLNRNLRFKLDYEETRFAGGKAGGDGNRPTEQVYLSRFQIAF